ncbi:T9SS type A sorting domain-containing protein [bacterium SCSIO 12741]|nr:T9SS type A sorting domain-containing protein [bacterium SCSIO 12741]
MKYKRIQGRLAHWGSLCFLSLLVSLVGYSQETVSSAGATWKTSNHVFEYALGEPLIETYSGGSGTFTTGVLQPELVITAIDAKEAELSAIMAYPNPFSSRLTFKSDAAIERIQIRSMLGVEVFNDSFENQNSIETLNWKPGTYIGSVWTKGSAEPVNFQLVKTH